MEGLEQRAADLLKSLSDLQAFRWDQLNHFQIIANQLHLLQEKADDPNLQYQAAVPFTPTTNNPNQTQIDNIPYLLSTRRDPEYEQDQLLNSSLLQPPNTTPVDPAHDMSIAKLDEAYNHFAHRAADLLQSLNTRAHLQPTNDNHPSESPN